MKRRLVIEANPDPLYPWAISEVDDDGVITQGGGTYRTIEEAEAQDPTDDRVGYENEHGRPPRWSDRVPSGWKPDVVRVGPWYEVEEYESC